MTKEWQEATEEYMKVRKFIVARAAGPITTCVLTHFIGPGNRAHHWLQGYDGPVGFGEEPSSRREAQRRVNERIKLPRTHNTNTNTNLTFPWVKFPFGTACVRYTTRSKGLRASAGLAHVILVPPCTEILEAFAIFALPSPLRSCAQSTVYKYRALQSTSSSLHTPTSMLVQVGDKLRTALFGWAKPW
jgi:hypothetical protein